jgi:hypothetical protein
MKEASKVIINGHKTEERAADGLFDPCNVECKQATKLMRLKSVLLPHSCVHFHPIKITYS